MIITGSAPRTSGLQLKKTDSCRSTGFEFITYIPINKNFNDRLSSGNPGLLDDNIRMRLNLLKKNQDLLAIISEHLTQDVKINIHELESIG